MPELAKLSPEHLSLPVLHYFHDISVRASGAVKLAVLDEALTILRHGLAPAARPDPDVVEPARRSVEAVLSTLTAAYISRAEESPEPPSLQPLRARGIPVTDEVDFRDAVATMDARRRALVAFVEDDGWSWGDVYPPREEEPSLTAPADSLASQPQDDDADDGAIP